MWIFCIDIIAVTNKKTLKQSGEDIFIYNTIHFMICSWFDNVDNLEVYGIYAHSHSQLVNVKLESTEILDLSFLCYIIIWCHKKMMLHNALSSTFLVYTCAKKNGFEWYERVYVKTLFSKLLIPSFAVATCAWLSVLHFSINCCVVRSLGPKEIPIIIVLTTLYRKIPFFSWFHSKLGENWGQDKNGGMLPLPPGTTTEYS